MNKMKKLLVLLLSIHFITIVDCQEILITNASVIDVLSGSVMPNTNLHIRNGKIFQLSQRKIKPTSQNTTLINAEGQYVIPGLIDGHVHTTSLPDDQAIDALQKTLLGGVTTVRDMGGDGIRIKEWLSNADNLKIPRVLHSCIMAGSSWMNHDFRARASAHGQTVGTSPWLKSVNTLTDVEPAIKSAKAFDVDGLKIYADISEELLVRIVQKAKVDSLPVYAHATVYPIGPVSVVEAGVDVISHAERLLTVLDSGISKTYRADRNKMKVYQPQQLNDIRIESLLQKMKSRNVALDATLVVSKLRANQFNTTNNTLKTVYEITKKAHEAGVVVIAGTDQMISPNAKMPNLHEEMRLLVEECGLSPIESLRAATINPSKFFRLQHIGLIKSGYVADLVLLGKNPLQNIRHTQSIKTVIKNGAIMD